MFNITESAAAILDSQYVIREVDRSGAPHLLVKVPDLERSPNAEIGLEVRREEDGCVVVSLLIYDIPTEPVSYELRFYPSQPGDLRFLHSFIDAAQFRMHPCARVEGNWQVAQPQLFRVPSNVLLRLKHFSLDWPDKGAGQAPTPPAPQPQQAAPAEPDFAEPIGEEAAPAAAAQAQARPADDVPRRSTVDPREKVINKLKEQNHSLRSQLREKDKRIIELEDELNEVKGRGRSFKFAGEKKGKWKIF